NRFAAIYDSVVVGHRQVHHRADHHASFASDGAFLNRVHAEHAALGRIHNGRGEERAIDAAVADGESAALELIHFQFVLLSAAGEIANGQFDFGEAQALSTAQNRDDQTFAAADRDADVVEIVVHDIGLAHFGIEDGEL